MTGYDRSSCWRRLQYWIAGVALLVACYARADDGWTLTTADFKTTAVDLLGIDGKSVAVTINGEAQMVPFASIIQLNRPLTDESVKGLVLCVAGGERLVGTPKKLDGQSLLWFTRGAGDISVPMESALGILQDKVEDIDLAADHSSDIAKLATGDLVEGIVTSINEHSFTFTSERGDPESVPVESVTSLMFAAPPGGHPPVSATSFNVHIAGGSIVAFKSIVVKGDTFTGDLQAGGSLKIPIAQITAIENIGGPVTWLSTRTPIESVYTPFLEGNFPPRMDRSVTGHPIRFDGTTYSRGIGVHSRTKLVYAVEPADGTFCTRYAIDGDLNYADVDVRILVDDKVVHAQKDFRAGVLTPVIEADLSHAKTLTLEVDYGQGLDVQDRLNWIEPAIVKK